jgi:alkylated DNA repair dioxygenase AlkB
MPARGATPSIPDFTYIRNFLVPEASASLMATLLDELEFESRSIVLFGKSVVQPRLIAWAGDLPYRYSGQTLAPRPWPGALHRYLTAIAQRCATPFNHVLLNLYRDGNDSMGMHSDDEAELGPKPVVAALSLGAPRRLRIAPRDEADEFRASVELENGSLMIMGPSFQTRFRHGIAKTKSPVQTRLSLTFRHILRAPSRER